MRDFISNLKDITYKNVLKVQPFANELVYVDFKGSEVLPYLTAV